LSFDCIVCTFRAPTSGLSKEDAVQLCFVRISWMQQSLNDAVPLNVESSFRASHEVHSRFRSTDNLR
jgi:hypothetical protein